MSLAFIFPGQGSQAVGMGAELDCYRPAREVFEEVDDALGQHLRRLMREGPIEELTLTENAQPALMAVSLAVMRILRDEMGAGVDGAAFVAGHSLGEYSALAAADALTVGGTARLLKLRGQAMQRAVPVGEGAMASLIGPKTDLALAERAAAAGAAVGVCVVANDNNDGNIVISGAKAAVDAAIAEAKILGARAVPLNVLRPLPLSADCSRPPTPWPRRWRPRASSRPRRRWWPTSPPARPWIPTRSAASWSSRSPAGCAGARAWSGWRRTASPASWRRGRARCWPAW